MGSNSGPDKQPALNEARLSALRAREPGDIIPPSHPETGTRTNTPGTVT